MIDRIRTLVGGDIVSSLTRYLPTNSTAEPSDDPPESDRPGPAVKRPPEDDVLKLLAENDGKMWQQSIVAGTEYSEPHVSRLLSRMEDDDLVERRWIRGQKVVVLEGTSRDGGGSELAASV